MRLCRFAPSRVGVVVGDQIADVTDEVAAHIKLAWPLPMEDAFIARLDQLRPLIEAFLPTASWIPRASVILLSPVANPPKLVAAPVNYAAHIAEGQADPDLHHGAAIKRIEEVGLFLKSSTSLVGPGEGLQIRFADRRNDHEIELAAIIGREAANVSRADALDYVAGYAIGLDMTVRGIEDRSFRKSPDSYSVLGPWMVTADEFGDPAGRILELWVGDELRQSADTSDLILDLPALIELASKWYTLKPGDVIFTGTPQGVGPVSAGDRIRARIAGIGEMEVQVRAPPSSVQVDAGD